MTKRELSRFIALILRHKPEVIGIQMDEHGWVRADELAAKIAAKKSVAFTMADLEDIVRTDEKQRYAFNEDKTKIRANQGHSIFVDVGLKEAAPPAVLWHGSGEKYAAFIDQQGLVPKACLYVHLSCNRQTATAVGRRHGRPVVYRIAAGKMAADGYVFYLSANGIWQTKVVPRQYIERCVDKIPSARRDS